MCGQVCQERAHDIEQRILNPQIQKKNQENECVDFEKVEIVFLKECYIGIFIVYFDPVFEQIKTNVNILENNSGFVDSGFVV